MIKNWLKFVRPKENFYFCTNFKKKRTDMTRVISRASILKANDSARNAAPFINTSSEWVSAKIHTSFGSREITIEKEKIFEAAKEAFRRHVK